MQFKRKQTKEKKRNVEIIDIEVMKPDRVELSRVEYDMLLSIFNNARSEPDLTKYKITRLALTARIITQQSDRIPIEDQQLVLDLDIV